jgi:hypothetical protein
MQSLVDFRIGRKRVIRSARDAESIRSGSRIFEILCCRCARQTVALLIFVVVLSPSVINETKHKKQLANRFRNRTVTPTGPNRKQPVTVGVTPRRGRKKKRNENVTTRGVYYERQIKIRVSSSITSTEGVYVIPKLDLMNFSSSFWVWATVCKQPTPISKSKFNLWPCRGLPSTL